MDVRVKQGSILEETADLVIVPLIQISPEETLGGSPGAVDGALGGLVRQLIASGEFTGKAGETALLHTRGALPAPISWRPPPDWSSLEGGWPTPPAHSIPTRTKAAWPISWIDTLTLR